MSDRELAEVAATKIHPDVRPVFSNIIYGYRQTATKIILDAITKAKEVPTATLEFIANTVPNTPWGWAAAAALENKSIGFVDVDVLISCRDHWKTSFEHERANVIRLREIVYKFHADDCICEDCQLVDQHLGAKSA